MHEGRKWARWFVIARNVMAVVVSARRLVQPVGMTAGEVEAVAGVGAEAPAVEARAQAAPATPPRKMKTNRYAKPMLTKLAITVARIGDLESPSPYRTSRNAMKSNASGAPRIRMRRYV